MGLQMRFLGALFFFFGGGGGVPPKKGPRFRDLPTSLSPGGRIAAPEAREEGTGLLPIKR